MDMLKRTRLYDHGDRISELPDCLILEILSRLPTPKDTIRTSCLSKRWRSLWTLLANLVFINKHKTEDSESRPYFSSFLDKTFTQLSRSHYKLDKFQLHSVYAFEFRPLVDKWIRYAINCNVQDLDVSLWGYDHASIRIVLDELFFNNSIFTHLKLSCRFVNPTGMFSWKNLKSLYISSAELNEDLIQNIQSGSPVLETFTLDNCFGFERLDITSKSVKKFVISGMWTLCEINDTYLTRDHVPLKAPNILSLKIQGSTMLWEIKLQDLSSLVEAYLDFNEDWDYVWDEEMLEKNIKQLRHVKELKLGRLCSETLSYLEADGFIAPSNIIHVVDDGPEGHEVD